MKLVYPLLVLVLLCAGSWAKMSKEEVNDFIDFLETNANVERVPNEEDLLTESDSDDAAAADTFTWEQSGKFEGDVVLSERQRKLLVEDVAVGLSRNGLRDISKRWPDNVVTYYIEKRHFSSDQVQAIEDGMDDISRGSCIKFKPHQEGDSDAVVIQGAKRGCFSQVGYQGGLQVLNLNARHPTGRGCFRHGTVVHELLHTLGFFHMQSSHDRDEYVKIVWDNIIEGAKHNFRKYNADSVTDFGVPYDYDSVLHYSSRAFSSNGGETIVPKGGFGTIGQRHGMSDKDAQKLNKMYCGSDSSSYDDVPTPVVRPDPAIQPRIPQDSQKTHKSELPHKTESQVLVNHPFEGQGLGYYQGNSIAIKLPNVTTYYIRKHVESAPDRKEHKGFEKPEVRDYTASEGEGYKKPEVRDYTVSEEDWYKKPEVKDYTASEGEGYKKPEARSDVLSEDDWYQKPNEEPYEHDYFNLYDFFKRHMIPF